MKKNEFLEILKQYLIGQVDSEVVNQNIRYYDQYISSQAYEEQAIQALGDPRLIAKTIIETNKISKQKKGDSETHYYNGNNETNYYNENYNKQESNSKFGQEHNGIFNIFFSKIKWYHKLIIAMILFITFFIVIYIGSVIIRFLFAFMLPIFIIVMLVSLFKKR